MKNYDERIESIFRKYDERLAEKKRRKKIAVRAALSAGAFAAAIAGVMLVSGDDLRDAAKFHEPDSIIIQPEPEDTAPANTVKNTETTTKRSSEKTTVMTTSTAAPETGTSTENSTESTGKTAEKTVNSTSSQTETITSETTSTTAKRSTSATTKTTATTRTTVTTTEPIVHPEPTQPEPPSDIPDPIGPSHEPRPDAFIEQNYYNCDFDGQTYHYKFWITMGDNDYIGIANAYGSDPAESEKVYAHAYKDADTRLYIAVYFNGYDGLYIYCSEEE